MSSSNLLPAFLAGFVAAAGIGAAVVPMLSLPLERELRAARDDHSSVQRQLLQEQALSAQLEAARDATARLAKDECKREVAAAVAEAEAKCAAASPAPPSAESVARLVAAEVAAQTAASLPPPISNVVPSPSPPPPASSSADALFGDGSLDCGACIASAHVLYATEGGVAASGGVQSCEAPAAAAAKWVLTPPRDGALQRRPSGADEVLLSYTARRGNVTLAHESRVLHRPDDPAGRTPTAGWGLALTSMRPGERAAFRFASAAEADDQQQQQQQQQSSELTYEIEMLGVTAVEVLSPSRRPSDRLLKTVLEGGAGAETPKDGARVIVDVAVEGRPSAPPSGDNATTSAGGDMSADAGAVQLRGLELTLGDGVGGEGLRLALMSMSRSELARVQMHPSLVRPPLVPSVSVEPSVVSSNAANSAELLVATIRLRSFEQQRALEHMGRQELFGHIERLKATANRRFAAGETEAACDVYDKAIRLLRLAEEDERDGLGSAEPSAPSPADTRALQLALRLNSAACALKAKRFERALAQADAALSLSPKSTKGLFRRGQALQALGRKGEAAAAYQSILVTEPASREAHQRLAELRGRDAAPTATASAATTTTQPAAAAAAAPAPATASGPAASATPPAGLGALGVPLVGGDGLVGASSPLVEASGGGGLGGLLRPGGGIVQLEGVGEAANAAAVTAEGSDAAVTAEGSDAELASYRGLDATELLSRVGVLKGEANKAFAAGDVEGACAQYERAIRILGLTEGADGSSDGTREEAKALQLALRLNGANCALKAKRFERALAQADAALSLSPNSTKGLFRRGQALQALGRMGEAEVAYGAVTEAEPASREAHQRLAEVRSSLAAAA